MKRHLLRAGAALAMLGAIAVARTGSSVPVSANIEGGKAPASPDTGEGGTGDDSASDRASASRAGAPAVNRADVRPKKKPRRLLGDAALRQAFAVDDAALRDGRYRVELDDGRTAVLTLDPDIQQAAEAVLVRAKSPKGAVVVMHVDGRILALAGRSDNKAAPELATSVWAPAASIFKVVTAAALVDAGVRPDAKVCYHGGLRSVVASNLVDDPKRDTQCNDLAYGVAKSQNAVVAKLVNRHLEPRELRAMARAFGFGDTPDFALDAEPARADIPDDDLDFARVAAGFWQTELSPLGAAMVAHVVASGGLSVTPRIVAEVVPKGASASIPVEPVEPTRVLPEHVARDVAHMMVGTTEGGTAHKGFHDLKGREFFPRFAVAGKTGTLTRRSPGYLQYSWFAGFAPADSPEIVIAVLLGNPQRWHLKAHTAARIVMQKAF